MAASSKTKKIAITGVASILLVAMCVAVAVGVTKSRGGGDKGGKGGGGITTTTKAVHAICSPTDYKQTCEQSLSDTNSSDPRELMKAAFEKTVKDIQEAIKNSTLYKEAASDERTKGALGVCEEVLNVSIDDLRRSFDKVSEFNADKMDEYVEDLKTWLSGAIANEETCIDTFENTTGDTGEKMKKLLNTSGELLSNGLAMVTDFTSILSSLQIGGFSSRRLLGDDGIPFFVDTTQRKLMATSASNVKANAVVAQDGSGQFKTITEAINTLPKKNDQPFVIHVKAGVYKETVIIPRKVNNVVLIGDGPTKTKLSGNKNYADGVQTFHTAVLAINGDGFIAKDIGIENTAGPEKHQAVAVRVSGDKAVFHNVQMDGYQDTLYAHAYRQFYSGCTITGTIDFIFGDAAAVFQKCRLVVRKPMNNQACMVTAQGRKDKRSVGVTVIQNSDITAEQQFLDAKPALKAFLGRPWKEYSRTIIMQSNIGGFIAPEGWSPWMGSFGLNTLYYGEYQNRGPGSDLSRRVNWKGYHKLSANEANGFVPQRVYNGDEWVKASGVPYVPGMM